MVDALREAWRVLVVGGILVDLRPVSLPTSTLEVVTAQGAVPVGEVDQSASLAGDLAADRAVARGVNEGLYRPRSRTEFDFELTWQSVAEMAAFLTGTPRAKKVTPSYAALKRILARRREAGGEVRLRFWRPMVLAVYRKAQGGKKGAGRIAVS